jgi:dTDP-4-dehydrorhamnose reductase
MKKTKVLILGSAGMAGHVIKNYLSNFTDLFNIYDVARSELYIKPTHLLDITDFNGLNNIFTNIKPDCVINCIGILNHAAEDNPDLAILINSYLPHFLEKIAKNSECKIIHISTDCVFSGLKGGYVESDFKDGIGFYAQSKALGEIENIKDLTIRTSIIGPELNESGIGLLNWFLKQKKEINGYEFAYWSGVTTLELAKFIFFVLTSSFNLNGIFHLTNNEKIDKFTLLNNFQKSFKIKDLSIIPSSKYKIDKSFINTNKNIGFAVSSYIDMINEIRDYILKYKSLYQYQIPN